MTPKIFNILAFIMLASALTYIEITNVNRYPFHVNLFYFIGVGVVGRRIFDYINKKLNSEGNNVQ